jgi:hypothetical protein
VGTTSWNANRINGDKLEDVIDELQRAMGKRIVLMQEVARLPVDPSIEGWTVLHGESCAAAIAVPRELTPEIRWRRNSDVTSSVLLGELGVMSAYFADSGKSMEEFEKSVMTARYELRKLRAAGARHLLVGCDAQVELPPNTEATGPQAVGDQGAVGVAHERQCLILELLREFGLRAASTWTESMPFHTRKPWQANRRCTQLDYIFVSKLLITNSGVCNDRQYGTSDHYPVWCDVLDSKMSFKTQGLRSSLSGWKPLTDHDADDFRSGIVESMGISGSAREDMRDRHSLASIQHHIEKTGGCTPHSTRHARWKSTQAKPDDLKLAEAASRAASPGEARRQCRQKEGKLRRKWKTERLLHGKSRPKRMISTLECDGTMTEDRQAWGLELDRYCSDKYFNPEETEEVQYRRYLALRSTQRAAELDGWSCPKLTIGIVLHGRARLRTGKCSGGGEKIVAEMLRLLPIAAVYIIADVFAKRYAGELVENVEAWKTIIMIFLQKVAKPQQMKHFRGISLLSVMSKWYMQCLYILAKRCPRPKAWNRVCIYSYECCLSTDYVTSALHLLLCRGWEWQLQSPVYVFNGDIQAAFDNMRPDTVVKALQAASLHPRIIAAMMAESGGTVCWPEFDSISLEHPIRFNKCAKQGGVESAYEWNSVMFMCLAELDPLWHESGYGVDLGGRRYTHAVWADNVWLFDHNPDNLKKMMQSLTTLLRREHLHWKPDSLCYMGSTSRNLEDMVVVDGADELAVPSVQNMEVLGTRLDRTGATTPSFQHRAAKAEKAFWSDKAVLLDKSIPLGKRFQRYVERVVPRFLHGCCSWSWCQSLCESIVVWEGKMLRRIVGSGRRPAEDWLAWFRRCTRSAKGLYSKMGFTSMTSRVLKEIHRAASRLQPPCQKRFTAAANTVVLLADAIEWKDTWWWHKEQIAGQILDPGGSTGWKHARNFGSRGKTWDGVLIYAYGLEWNLVAKNTERWANSFEIFVSKAYEFAKSSPPRSREQLAIGSADEPPIKRPRILSDLILPWTQYDNEIGAEVVGDNELVINWANGLAIATGTLRSQHVECLVGELGNAWHEGLIAPRTPSTEWCRHVYRERNKAADELANRAMDSNTSTVWQTLESHSKMHQLCAHFDGGKRGDSSASCGWHLQGSYDLDTSGEPVWYTLAWGSVVLDPTVTSADAELHGLTEATRAVLSWARYGRVVFDEFAVQPNLV